MVPEITHVGVYVNTLPLNADRLRILLKTGMGLTFTVVIMVLSEPHTFVFNLLVSVTVAVILFCTLPSGKV